jgi:glutathione S-transferase
MENSEQRLPVALRQLQPSIQSIGHHHPHSTLASQLPPELHSLAADPHAFHQRIQTEIGPVNGGSNAPQVNRFGLASHLHSTQTNGQPHTPQRQQHGTAYGVLTPSLSLPSQHHPQPGSMTRLQQEHELSQTPENGGKGDGHFGTMKMIPNPPNLDEWRNRLFDVSDTLSLTEDE